MSEKIYLERKRDGATHGNHPSASAHQSSTNDTLASRRVIRISNIPSER